MPCNGPVIPFGAMVEYHPISAKDISRLHQFGPKVLPVIFLGYASNGGKETFQLQTMGELEQMDATELHASRLNAKEVLTPMKMKNSVPSRRWNSENFWRRSSLSTLIRKCPERGEEQEVLRGESDGLSSPAPLQGSSWFDGEAKK